MRLGLQEIFDNNIEAMSLSALVKIPHPIQDQSVADRNRRTICEVRGYCGPFINQSYYRRFPDPLWQTTGECVVCCNTCNVVVEDEKQQAAIAGALQLRPNQSPSSGSPIPPPAAS